jgi:predicted transposase YdaD
LKQITDEDSKSLRKYLDMLEILSDNRDLKTHIKEAEAMLTQVDVERLPSYELGMEKGMEKGMERGMERGMETGMQKGEARLLSRLLRLKFGDLPAAVEQRIEKADEAALLRWSERVLTAARLEDVLN